MNKIHESRQRLILFWLYTGCFLVFSMVVVGGITRLTGSGLSITEWKLVTGTLPPITDAQWNQEFINYQQSPQFQKINAHFDVNNFKQIYWWEYFHRLIGRMIGVVFLIPFFLFYFKKWIEKKLMPKLIIIFLLGAWQGFLGWYMVKSGLVDNPFVSHIRLAIHLVNAFITFGYIFWVALDLKHGLKHSNSSPDIKSFTLASLVILVIQITYGAFVAGLHAGKIFNTWPMMGDEWISSAVSASFQNEGLSAIINNIVVVQFIHRSVGILFLVLIFIIWIKRNKVGWKLSAQSKASIQSVTLLVLIQVMLGVFTLLLAVPLWLGVLHQAFAFALFAASVNMVHRIFHS